MLEEGEVFDSSLLKETVNSMIADGKRNFAIDLAVLDYLYSDAINVLIALNKRILDVSGRLSLLSPQAEVLQILKRAGVHNILKVFDSENDLIRSSEDIILQTSSFRLADIKQLAEEGIPKSEFDDLRSEIGSAFGATSHRAGPESQQKPVDAIIEEDLVAPPRAMQNEPADFRADLSSMETPVAAQDEYVPPQRPIAPASAGFAPLPPAAPRSFAPPQFQPRQYAPPPPPPPPRPAQPQGPLFEPTQKPPTRSYMPPPQGAAGADFLTRPETQRFVPSPGAPLPVSRKPEPIVPDSFDDDLDGFEDAIGKKGGKAPSRGVQPEDSFDDDEEIDSVRARKKSAAPALLVVLLLLIVGGAGAFFGYWKFFKTPQVVTAPSPVASAAPEQMPAVPQLPVETVAPVTEASVEPEAKVEEPPAPEPPAQVQQKPAAKVTRSVTPPKPKPVSKPVPRVAATPSKPVSSVNQLVVTSNPSGAIVSINGKEMGLTPYTWDSPFYGGLSMTLSKAGYKSSTKNVEFTGGSMKEFFSLEKETPPPAAYVPPPTYAKEPEPVRAAPPPPAASIPAEPSDFGSDLDAPEPSPMGAAPVVSAPPPQPVAPAASSLSGEPATIFIASIPPVADVYLDGKLIGKTNISELKVVAGTHTMRFVKAGKEITKDMTFQAGKNPSQMVRLP